VSDILTGVNAIDALNEAWHCVDADEVYGTGGATSSHW
jgi:hypothetical protein